MRPALAALALCAAALPAAANSGLGGIAATGLTFTHTDAVEMRQEELFISPDLIRVDTLFRNITDQDVTGEIIFPLPPLKLEAIGFFHFNLPEQRSRENLVNFSATVDGTPVDVKIDPVAVIEPPWEEGRAVSTLYDTPGRDVTALLEALGVPVSLDLDAVREALQNLSPEDRATAEAEGLVAPNGIVPRWSVLFRYHWTQTFPAGARLRIHQEYENRPPAADFLWGAPGRMPDWLVSDQAALREEYCIDDEMAATILARLMPGEEISFSHSGYVYGAAYYWYYVLRTANSWAGPIGRFRLILDRGSPVNLLATCAGEMQQVDMNTFVIEKAGFSPDKDLSILLIVPGYGG